MLESLNTNTKQVKLGTMCVCVAHMETCWTFKIPWQRVWNKHSTQLFNRCRTVRASSSQECCVCAASFLWIRHIHRWKWCSQMWLLLQKLGLPAQKLVCWLKWAPNEESVWECEDTALVLLEEEMKERDKKRLQTDSCWLGPITSTNASGEGFRWTKGKYHKQQQQQLEKVIPQQDLLHYHTLSHNVTSAAF